MLPCCHVAMLPCCHAALPNFPFVVQELDCDAFLVDDFLLSRHLEEAIHDLREVRRTYPGKRLQRGAAGPCATQFQHLCPALVTHTLILSLLGQTGP